jgi:hypothetical protein
VPPTARKSDLLKRLGGVSGPIAKDKVFFFELGRARQVRRRALTVAGRLATGDLSSLEQGIIIRDPLTGLPFPNKSVSCFAAWRAPVCR